MAAMKGRCYGCGSKDHVKANGNHGGTKCPYCARNGHVEAVCQDKYLGLARNRGANPRRQRVAGTTTGGAFSLFPEEAAAAPAPPSPAPAASVASTSSAELWSQMASLQASIAEQNRLLGLATTASSSGF